MPRKPAITHLRLDKHVWDRFLLAEYRQVGNNVQRADVSGDHNQSALVEYAEIDAGKVFSAEGGAGKTDPFSFLRRAFCTSFTPRRRALAATAAK